MKYISVLVVAVLLFNPVICRLIFGEDSLDLEVLQLLDGLVDEEIESINPTEREVEEIEFIPIFPKRNLLTSLESTDKLSEWTPIASQMGINQTQYFEFVVNTTQLGLGEYYEILIFLSGNICSLPKDLRDVHSVDNQLKVYYSYNQTDLFNLSQVDTMATFEYGYMQALASNPAANPYSNLYIAVVSPYTDHNVTGVWSFELGISQNDLVFQWDDRSWADLVDSDDDSALFVTGNLSSRASYSNESEEADIYKLHIYSYDDKDYFTGLNRSWCAVKNGPALISPDGMETQITSRYGNLKQQFYVDGLNSSTYYIAYLTQDFGGGTGYGGSIFQQFSFETLDENSCELIYDLSFCEEVAYSVPVSSGFLNENNETSYQNKALLTSLYDNYTSELYENFGKAIQVIACDDELDSRYSPIRTCSDCITSYKSWLCAVSIPRCSTRNVTGYKYRDLDENRNEFINDVIIPPQPYFEILPCVNMCQAIVRDCPADFGFECPTNNRSVALSYFWDESNEEGYSTCNYFGTSSTLNSNSEVSTKISKSLASLLKVDKRILVLAISLNLILLA